MIFQAYLRWWILHWFFTHCSQVYEPLYPQKTLYFPCKIKGFVKSWCEDQPQQIHRFYTQLSHHFTCFFYKFALLFRHWFDDVVLDVLFMDLDRQTAPLWPPMWPSWSSVRPCPSQIGQKSCPKRVPWRIKNQYFSSEGLLGVPWPRFGSLVARLWPHVAAINAHFLPYLTLQVVVDSGSDEKLDAYFNAESPTGNLNFRRNFLQARCGILASGN